eukprot:748-Pelagomonas_calceolata.AAC.1
MRKKALVVSEIARLAICVPKPVLSMHMGFQSIPKVWEKGKGTGKRKRKRKSYAGGIHPER